jgi:uncharacterized protein YkwD
MKIHLHAKLILIACGVALGSCASPIKTTKVYVSAPLNADNSLSGRIFREVNAYRKSSGSANLERHLGLDQLAQEHCEYLRVNRGSFDLYGANVSHYGSEARAELAKHLYNAESSAENVACTTNRGKSTAAHLVNMWAASKNHDYAMRESWTHTGIGVVVDKDGAVFCTQIFASLTHQQIIRRIHSEEF